MCAVMRKATHHVLADARIAAGQRRLKPKQTFRIEGRQEIIRGRRIDVAKRVGPSVVRLDIRHGGRGRAGSGSGVILSPDGLVLTNSHVAQGAKHAGVTLLDGRSLSGRVLGDDPGTDLALVRIDEDATLPPARLGNSKSLKPGEIYLGPSA